MRGVKRSWVCVVIAGALLSSCGGSSDSTATAPTLDSLAPSTTVAETTTTPLDTVAPSTVPASTVPAPFDGPLFTDVIDAALAPYEAAIADPTAVSAALPTFTPDVPLPGGVVTGVARTVEQWDADTVYDDQFLTFDTRLDPAALEAFGGAAGGGWSQASFATSGSLTTLLLTTADGRRASYVTDSDTTSARPPMEMDVRPAVGVLTPPAWVASLPVMAGGQVVDYAESVGHTSEDLLGQGHFVQVRVRYGADSLDALGEYLASGVLQSAGFAIDVDQFNGFEELVDVTIGDWTGSVIIGNARVNDQQFYDIVWSLGR